MSINSVRSTLINSSMRQTEQAKQSDSTASTVAAKPKNDEVRNEQAQPASAPDIEAAATQIDRYLKSVSRSLEFRVDKPSGHTVVSVRDTETGDVIRQFPGDEVLRLAEMAQEQTIVLVREKV
jgi:flagellar protein FlaG